MLFGRFVVSALLRAAQNPAVQKKIGEATGKAINRARPSLLSASRKAGELKRKVTQNILDDK